MGKWITIRTCFSRSEAEIAKGLLEQNGITTRLIADDAGGMRPELTFSTGVRIQVEEEDEADARGLFGE